MNFESSYSALVPDVADQLVHLLLALWLLPLIFHQGSDEMITERKIAEPSVAKGTSNPLDTCQ